MAKNIIIKATAAIMLLLLFVSCKSQSPADIDISEGFSCTVTANCNGKEYSANLLKSAVSVYEITISSPDELSGMKLKYQGGEVTIEYLGLSHKIQADAIPETAFFAALITCLDSSSSLDNLKYEGTEDSVYHYTGTCDSNKFDLYYDSQSKKIKEISVNALSLTVLFD